MAEIFEFIAPILEAPWLLSKGIYYKIANAHYEMSALDRQIFKGDGDIKEKHKRFLRVLDQTLNEFLSLPEDVKSNKSIQEYINALIDMRKETVDLSK